MRNSRTVTIYTNRTEIVATFPARWVICPACEGNATTTRHIEPDGGGFTATEWADACGDDPDFADDYFGGRYDRPCPDCAGLGRMMIIDESAIVGWRAKILFKHYCEQLSDSAEIDAIQAAERRAGA
jgi:hypothetical protein